MADLLQTFKISAAGMRAQSTRLRVISENIANASSLPTEPGKQPYRRKVITFKNEFDKAAQADLVHVDKIKSAPGDFKRRFDPSHPAADDNGYVLAPNINTLIEVMDMKEAQRSYDANLNVIRTSRTMMTRTLELLR